MKFHELEVSSNKQGRRVGRGIAAGRGKTAGRGTKGQKAREGNGRRPGFEGGQNPLMQRMPKLRGFKSIRPKAENVYTGELASISGTIDNFSVFEAGLVSSPYVLVKLIAKGDVSKKHTVKLQAASVTAIEAVKKAGGSFEAIERVKRQKQEKTEEKTSRAAKKSAKK